MPFQIGCFEVEREFDANLELCRGGHDLVSVTDNMVIAKEQTLPTIKKLMFEALKDAITKRCAASVQAYDTFFALGVPQTD